jgi:hypothetical protein
MIVSVKGCFAGEVLLDTDRYPELGELLRSIIAAEFLGESKCVDASAKKRGRPPKQPQPIPEATPAAVENDNASPV